MKQFLALATLLVSSVALGVPVERSDERRITAEGQQLGFKFSELPSSGSDGRLRITLNGDFGGESAETSAVAIDGVEGYIEAGYVFADDAIVSNKIEGMSLANYERRDTQAPSFDRELVFEFSVGDSLLDDMLASGEFGISASNGSNVSPYNTVDEDFVAVGLSYDDTTTATSVPSPAPFLLLALGLIGLRAIRRDGAVAAR